jgi:hypothetical protein
MSNQAGKGDSPRPVNRAAWDAAWERIEASWKNKCTQNDEMKQSTKGGAIAGEPTKLWIVYQWTNEPEFQGVFSTKDKALVACITDHHLICPAVLDRVVTGDKTTWPGAWYPHLEDEP